MGTENIPPNTGASGSISQNLSQMALVDHMDWTNVPGRRIYENGPVVVENILYTQFGEVFIYASYYSFPMFEVATLDFKFVVAKNNRLC